eukprot:5497092-Amphidinium_carterae.1
MVETARRAAVSIAKGSLWLKRGKSGRRCAPTSAHDVRDGAQQQQRRHRQEVKLWRVAQLKMSVPLPLRLTADGVCKHQL